MTRTTATALKNACGGTWVGGWTSVTASIIPAAVDRAIDSVTSPYTISYTSDAARALGDEIGLRYMRRGTKMMAMSAAESGDGMTYPEIKLITDGQKERIWAALKTSSSGIMVLSTMAD